MNERINERKKHGDVWIVNCESQRYRTIKQRHYNGLVKIPANILRMMNIYTVIQELWIFTLWLSDKWMRKWKWMKKIIERMSGRKNKWKNELMNKWMNESDSVMNE